MKVKMIRTSFVGGQIQEFDAIVDLPEKAAKELLVLGRAVPVVEQPKPKKKKKAK